MGHYDCSCHSSSDRHTARAANFRIDFGIPSKPKSVPVFCQGSGLNHQTHTLKTTKKLNSSGKNWVATIDHLWHWLPIKNYYLVAPTSQPANYGLMFHSLSVRRSDPIVFTPDSSGILTPGFLVVISTQSDWLGTGFRSISKTALSMRFGDKRFVEILNWLILKVELLSKEFIFIALHLNTEHIKYMLISKLSFCQTNPRMPIFNSSNL